MTKFSVPKKYQKIWQLAKPLLRSRPGDVEHSQTLVKLILEYKGRVQFDADVLVPVAILHDIGHAAILQEHLKYVTGQDKILNAKLVHMLTGSKIASEILSKAKYDRKKIAEIIEIISIHDMDQLKGVEPKHFYNSSHKKLFHDFDAFDRYNSERIGRMSKLIKDKKKFLQELKRTLDMFFFEEFRVLAEENLKKLH